MPKLRAFRSLGCLLSLVLACTEKSDSDTDGTTSESSSESSTTGSHPTTGGESSETATTTGADSSTSTSSPADPCECGDGEPCAGMLCEPAVWVEDGEGAADIDLLAMNVQCALAALRDRKAGTIRWAYQSGDGQIDEYGFFEMFGDGTARYTRGGVIDLCEWLEEDVAVVTLQATSVYADCLAAPDLLDRHNCIRATPEMFESVCFEAELECSI